MRKETSLQVPSSPSRSAAKAGWASSGTRASGSTRMVLPIWLITPRRRPIGAESHNDQTVPSPGRARPDQVAGQERAQRQGEGDAGDAGGPAEATVDLAEQGAAGEAAEVVAGEVDPAGR